MMTEKLKSNKIRLYMSGNIYPTFLLKMFLQKCPDFSKICTLPLQTNPYPSTILLMTQFTFLCSTNIWFSLNSNKLKLRIRIFIKLICRKWILMLLLNWWKYSMINLYTCGVKIIQISLSDYMPYEFKIWNLKIVQICFKWNFPDSNFSTCNLPV